MATRTQEVLKFTYADYEKLPDDGKRYEIIGGELFMTPAPYPKHQIVLNNINNILQAHVRQNEMGVVLFALVDFVLSDINIVQPDLFFIKKERLSIIGEKNIQSAPDLAVEILSPHSEKLDRVHKKNLYEKFGVKEYWLVDTKEDEVEIFYSLPGKGYASHSLFKGSEKVRSRIFSGLKTSVKNFFKSDLYHRQTAKNVL